MIKDLLVRMYESAEDNNQEQVVDLNRIFEEELPPLGQRSPEDIDCDNLRQSCVMSLSVPAFREMFLDDAYQRLNSLYGYQRRN